MGLTAAVTPLHAAPARRAADRELLASCAAGDRAALGLLYERLHRDVFRFAAHLVGAASPDLDDLVQTTFVQAWSAASRYRGEAEVRTWLFGICANVCRNHLRWSFRRRRAFVLLTDLQVHDVFLPAEENAIRRQKLERLSQALADLPPNQREAFVLCDVEGASGFEAATVLGIPPGTLGRRLHDARQKLRRAVDGDVP